jgi:methionyl-tRNA synthetase
MTDDIERATREAGQAMDRAAAYITAQANVIERLRQERAELRRALYECAYCLNSLDVAPSAMTKTTADTIVQLNLGGFND